MTKSIERVNILKARGQFIIVLILVTTLVLIVLLLDREFFVNMLGALILILPLTAAFVNRHKNRAVFCLIFALMLSMYSALSSIGHVVRFNEVSVSFSYKGLLEVVRYVLESLPVFCIFMLLGAIIIALSDIIYARHKYLQRSGKIIVIVLLCLGFSSLYFYRLQDYYVVRGFRTNSDIYGYLAENKLQNNESLEGELFFSYKFPPGTSAAVLKEYFSSLKIRCSDIKIKEKPNSPQQSKYMRCYYESSLISSLLNLNRPSVFFFYYSFYVYMYIDNNDKVSSFSVSRYQDHY